LWSAVGVIPKRSVLTPGPSPKERGAITGTVRNINAHLNLTPGPSPKERGAITDTARNCGTVSVAAPSPSERGGVRSVY